jgi:anhydro-N-acetylmuramic acid kinase
MALVMGLNSGSSFDGMDAVLIDVEIAADGHPARPRFIAGLSYDWPSQVAERILAAFDNKVDLFEMTRLNYEAGAVYAQAALALLDQEGISGEDLFVVGYDGQTIYQEPPDHARMAALAPDASLVQRWSDGGYGCGFQIGESAVVAAATQAPTVTHFRPMDHALGGTGAPLMQYLDFASFRDAGPVLTLNIGGIANCQLADADRANMMAFDTGPGNVMIDHAATQLLGIPYDANGQTAARGTVNPGMLDRLTQHPYFQRQPPRSAWRLDFGAGYADQAIADAGNLHADDILATLTAFTAWAIDRSIRDHVHNLDEISTLIASGGGVRNATLMRMLGDRLPDTLRLTTSDEFGLPPQYKEAIKFGVLAFAHRHGLANNIPAASGASAFAVLGRAVEPPRLAVIDPPTLAAAAPARLGSSDHD